ncbi:MAG: hypothetical protein HYR64_08235 [Fimbriimonas ginsengisoli]|uniref:Uncharacterized protein n=1 Tax=Fimbriimonas ginsengisoli TaxID=1005039 RepID=A0A931M188_FIMGI|nr:hypothetical protein [Fimbriimonas ginsengisoli]
MEKVTGISRRELMRAMSLGAAALSVRGLKALALEQPGAWAGFRSAAINATNLAIQDFKLKAFFSDVQIMAVAAIGGKLNGPELAPVMLAELTRAKVPTNIAQAFSAAVSEAWHEWRVGVSVPGLPWYPAFAAFPGPMAPPMPNVPMPIGACVSRGLGALQIDSLANRIVTKLGTAAASTEAKSAVRDFAMWFSLSFTVWSMSAPVMLVMGKGPVPTFAPPYVPVGPVVMGDIIAAPGHLMNGVFGLPEAPTFVIYNQMDTTVGPTTQAKLVNGSIRVAQATTELEGTVRLGFRANPNAHLTIQDGRAVLGKAPSPVRLGGIRRAGDATGAVMARPLSSSSLPGPFTTLHGEGKLEVTFGEVTLGLPHGMANVKPDGAISFTGGSLPVLGAPFVVGPGSRLTASELALHGFVNFPVTPVTDVVLNFTQRGVRGTGKVNAFGHLITLNLYRNTRFMLAGSGEYAGKGTAWQGVPGAPGLEFQAANPRISLSISGPTISPLLRIGKLTVRSVATKPDGSHWSQADLVDVAVTPTPTGPVPIPWPNLPQPTDIFAASRQAAQQAANLLPPGPRASALAKALQEFPSPPAIPKPPATSTFKVGSILG